MKKVSLLVSAMLVAALTLLMPGPAGAVDSVTVGSQSHVLSGTDVSRAANYLVKYTPAYGARTGTNVYGFEAAVVNGKVTVVQNGVGNMAIPADGFVLSGHGEARTWLLANATVGATVTDGSTPPPPPPPTAANFATINGFTHTVAGTNKVRAANELVRYTPSYGVSTGTNAFGFEVAVVGGVITARANGIGNMAIPAGGYVLSGHGEARNWLQAHGVAGAAVDLTATPPSGGGGGGGSGQALLPDVGVRTLRAFTVTTTGGRKLLKFPVVTVNVGDGPLEITGIRSSSTSTDWVARQVVYSSDGTKTPSAPAAATFYYSGDGHNHWHIRDFDLYELYDAAGTVLKTGEKHGFCFDDNTTYRDWVGSAQHPNVPLSAVYAHDNSCGNAQPAATSILDGLSVGWGDTYPSSLPDQGIDVTGVPDGTYLVKVTADWQHFWEESNESNNSASAQVRITGSTVTLLSATDGL